MNQPFTNHTAQPTDKGKIVVSTSAMTAGERLWTMKDVCWQLQISDVSGWRLYKERGLKVIHIGRAIRVRESDLQAWLEKNATTSGSDSGTEGTVQ